LITAQFVIVDSVFAAIFTPDLCSEFYRHTCRINGRTTGDIADTVLMSTDEQSQQEALLPRRAQRVRPGEYRHKWYIVKSRFFRLHFTRRMCRWDLQLLVRNRSQMHSEFGEITHTTRPLRRSRSFKVIDFGTNRKPICDFLLVINSNLPSILHRFQVTADYTSNFC